MKGNDIRKAYLEFFRGKEHLVMDSFSLIPDNDPSLLLIGAGMAPLKPFFTGKLVPPNPRITTCQKCIRTGDIENVGRTARHHTFFEMLGNFSFGNYFKKEAITWAWEFLTEVLKLEKDKLYMTIYPDDEEAYETWISLGVAPSHISRLEDNFWEIGEGPCGPDSEIFYDLGEARGCDSETCAPGCDCDRYLEIWNLVFTQFNRTAEGTYEPLEKKNIDTGAGLERLASVLQKTESNFETDLIFPIIEKTMDMAGVKYHEDSETDVSLKVIADHIRAITCLIADGVLPSNEGRGYVLRRTLRRAVRHGRLLGIERLFLVDLVDVVMDILGEGIAGLGERREYVKRVVQNEEERFHQTLSQGLELLQKRMEELSAADIHIVAGEDVFKLYDTYGFPLELTEEIAREAGFSLDHAGFETAMEEQRTRAREARAVEDAKVATPDITFLAGETLLDNEEQTDSVVLMLGVGAQRKCEVTDGETITVIFKETPFHAEGGGQLGDIGFVQAPMGRIRIENTKKLPEGTTYHIGVVEEGVVKEGDVVHFVVDTKRREQMAKNHTATHLLHAALRKVLGEHVTQAGSQVMPDRLRFDFTHFSPMTEEEIRLVEDMINEEIQKAMDLEVETMSMQAAKEKGAMALFGEKYGDEVRVVAVPGFSTELCGGTHVPNTAVIGTFRLVSESGIGAGVRRIEAITGRAAYESFKADATLLQEVVSALKAKPESVLDRILTLQQDMKAAEKELAMYHQKEAAASILDLIAVKKTVHDTDVLVAKVEADSVEDLRNKAEIARDQLGSGVVLVAAFIEEKIQMVCMATKDVVKKGIHAGQIVKAAASAIGGGGGGRPDMAQAGASGSAGDGQMKMALAAGFEAIENMLQK